MEGQFKNEKIKLGLFIIICVLACSQKQIPDKKQINYEVSSIQNGDIIYRLGNGLFSNFFRDASKRDKRFSHVGIVYKATSTDSIYVIHAEADDYSGIGLVKKEPISIYLKDNRDWAIYRLKTSDSVQGQISTYAQQYHIKKVPFDMAFDCRDSSAFYCTELVAHCINNAFKKEIIRANTIHNNKPFVALDDTYLIDSVKFINIKSKNTFIY